MKFHEMWWGKFLLAFVVVILLAFVSEMSYQDEIAERETYCDMVEAGKWPDYKGIYATECSDK